MLNVVQQTLLHVRYPNAAGKIVSNGPYSSVAEIFNIKGLSGKWGRGCYCTRYMIARSKYPKQLTTYHV